MSDDLDDILNEIEDNQESKEIVQEQSKEITNKQEVDVTEFESLASKLMEMTIEDRELADKTFKLFYPDIAMGRDKTKASAEAITKAVELKINAGKNIIDILKLLKTEEKSKGANIGIFFGEKKSGINLKNIMDEIDE